MPTHLISFQTRVIFYTLSLSLPDLQVEMLCLELCFFLCVIRPSLIPSPRPHPRKNKWPGSYRSCMRIISKQGEGKWHWPLCALTYVYTYMYIMHRSWIYKGSEVCCLCHEGPSMGEKPGTHTHTHTDSLVDVDVQRKKQCTSLFTITGLQHGRSTINDMGGYHQNYTTTGTVHMLAQFSINPG